ncbi:Extended synaptotagmin-3 [Fusarium albosuccineum]|uniref:Extended synaptotagmin-3 n=1 Tax=Fusarium albosuccineum TaxID=1237068 RepID=A0A8H4P7Y3_9HYPO|nr:Extended synaptotagmin-3 [Fusarium albosuccineum]
MASLVDTLTASGGTESAGFLNDIVAQLWPNINVAGGRMIKQIVEPMLESMLPGPLSTLHFVKLDFGPTPIHLSHVDVHKTELEGIKLDMDLEWDGKCDFELDGKMVPKIIGAAQVAFINPPTLELDFTDAANIADFSLIDKTIRKVILDIIASMAVLPNRFLVKLDSSNDYFKTYQHHLGVIRLTVGTATGITGPKKSGAKRLLEKLVKDVPDCYCEVNVGAEGEWRTTTQKNKHDPEWNETHDFLVTDYDQCITIDVQDDDVGSDDDIGIAATTVKQILLNGGTQELSLVHKGQPTESKLTVHAKFFDFVGESNTISAAGSQSEGQICGLASVLIAGVVGLTGQRDELNPSVKVQWGDKEFVTPAKTYSPGTDIFNPAFDSAFRFPITADMLSSPPSFKLKLMNGTTESGSYEVPYEKVAGAGGMNLEEEFDVGSGAAVRARISLRGLQPAK